MITDRLRTKTVTQELGYVHTEELGTQWLQIGLEQNGYRRTRIREYRRTWNTKVTDLRPKWLQKNWEQNGYGRT
jgi:hypothetical protein